MQRCIKIPVVLKANNLCDISSFLSTKNCAILYYQSSKCFSKKIILILGSIGKLKCVHCPWVLQADQYFPSTLLIFFQLVLFKGCPMVKFLLLLLKIIGTFWHIQQNMLFRVSYYKAEPYHAVAIHTYIFWGKLSLLKIIKIFKKLYLLGMCWKVTKYNKYLISW